MPQFNGNMVPPLGHGSQGQGSDPSFLAEYQAEGAGRKLVDQTLRISYSKEFGELYNPNKKLDYGEQSENSQFIFVKRKGRCDYIIYMRLYVDVAGSLGNGCTTADVQSMVKTLEKVIKKHLTSMKCPCKNAKAKTRSNECQLSVRVLWSNGPKEANGKPGFIRGNCKKLDGGECGNARPGTPGGDDGGLEIRTGPANANNPNYTNEEECFAHEMGHLLLTASDGDHEDKDDGSIMNGKKGSPAQVFRPHTICKIAARHGACPPKDCCPDGLVLASAEAKKEDVALPWQGGSAPQRGSPGLMQVSPPHRSEE